MEKFILMLMHIAASILLLSGCAPMQTYPVNLATASPEQIRELRASIVQSSSVRRVPPPSSWQQQYRWSPRRYFGPLHGSSPDLHLNGETATFVYNRFFANHPDATIFQKYYGTPLPTNSPTLAEAIPGTIPSSGFKDVRLFFDQLKYSSKYGGSFRLIFRPLEDLQLEYRKSNTAWDIGALEVNVYVRAVPTYFNPNNALFSIPESNINVEFRPQNVIAYTVTTGNKLVPLEGDPLPGLLSALADTAQTIISGSTNTPGYNFRRDASRFSHGLVHAAFWDDIGHTYKVTGIEITDDFFLPRTTWARPAAVVSFQATNVRLNTEPGNEEIYVTIDAGHKFKNVDAPLGYSWEFPEIDNGESTYWRSVGVFPLDWDCGQLETVFLMTSVREDDTGVFDDRFITEPRLFETGPLDCDGMKDAFNNGQVGLYRELPEQQQIIINDDGEVEGALSSRTRIYLIKQ